MPLLLLRILNRPKQGFLIPIKTWFRGVLDEFVREKLLASKGPCLSFFPRREIARVLDAHARRDCSYQIYALLVFDEWYSRFIKDTRVPRGAEAVAERQ